MALITAINRLRGREPARYVVRDAAGLVRDWTFACSPVSAGVKLCRARALLGVRPAPAAREIIAVRQAPRWTCYFIYLPGGVLTPAHRFTLTRLRAMDRRLLIVCATPAIGDVPSELTAMADALWWKALPGFDFSAYAIAVTAVASASPGAELLVMNDSVLGPFGNLADWLSGTPWDFTGLTAFSLIENHIQSYAFAIREVRASTPADLSSAFSRRIAFDRYADVIYGQESRLARRVSQAGLSVGARWFAQAPQFGDPTIYSGLDLLRHGFPFLKRSLLTRHPDLYPRHDLLSALEERGHPLAGLPGEGSSIPA